MVSVTHIPKKTPLEATFFVYEEERESIFGSGRIAGILRRMREAMREARQFREVPWEKLDSNRDRAKYIYRHFLRNCAAAGFAFNSALTPNETSRAINDWRPQPGQEAAALTPIYNRARYGPDDTDLDDSVIKEAKEAAKELNLK